MVVKLFTLYYCLHKRLKIEMEKRKKVKRKDYDDEDVQTVRTFNLVGS